MGPSSGLQWQKPRPLHGVYRTCRAAAPNRLGERTQKDLSRIQYPTISTLGHRLLHSDKPVQTDPMGLTTLQSQAAGGHMQ